MGHAFENPHAEECVMLSIGPSHPAEVCVYPDSGKAKFRAMDATVNWPQDSLDYWDGEAVDTPIDSIVR